MSQDHSSPAEQPRASTSIDELMESSGAEPAAEEVPAELTGRKRKGRKAAAAEITPEKQLSGLRTFFAFCFAAVLVAGVLAFDEVGPSADRSARVTERYIERRTKGGRDYVVEGVDDRGGSFEVDVSKSTHGRVSVGDRVVVTRSLLTGRVVEIDGPGWDYGGSSWTRWVWRVVGGLALLGLWWSWRTMRRTALPKVSDADRRQHRLRTIGWMAAGVVGVTAWVLWERADANVSAGSSPANAVDTIDSASGRCEVGASTVETWLAVFAVDGVLSTGDVERATALADQGDGDCMKGELEAIACDVLERLLLTSVRPLVREPATLCGGR